MRPSTWRGWWITIAPEVDQFEGAAKAQSPGDLDYRCRDNIKSWYVGRIGEKMPVDERKPLLSECRIHLGSKLASAKPGEFFKLEGGEPSSQSHPRADEDRSDFGGGNHWRGAAEQERLSGAAPNGDAGGRIEGWRAPQRGPGCCVTRSPTAAEPARSRAELAELR